MFEPFRQMAPLRQNILLTLVVLAVAMPMYTATNIIYGDRPGMSLATFIDDAVPFLPFSILGYALVYVFIFLPAFTIQHRAVFTRVFWGFLLLSLMALPFFVFMPVRVPRPGVPTQESFFYWGVAFNYVLDKPVNAFPSLHVANSVFAAACCVKLSRRVGLWGIIGSTIIAISTLTVRQHFLADVIAATAIALGVYFVVVHPVIQRELKNRPAKEMTFQPRVAVRVAYVYLGFLTFAALLFMAGLRFAPVLPTN